MFFEYARFAIVSFSSVYSADEFFRGSGTLGESEKQKYQKNERRNKTHTHIHICECMRVCICIKESNICIFFFSNH